MTGRTFGVFEELPLNPAIHDSTSFDCGIPALNEYLQRYADQYRKRGISSIYVLVERNSPQSVLGCYTLSAAEVDSSRLSESERHKLPLYPIPCFRLGRLACSVEQRGRGIGKRLLALAVGRCLTARAHIAAYVLIVDVKDNNARGFYTHFGFMGLSGSAMAMYLPLAAMHR